MGHYEKPEGEALVWIPTEQERAETERLDKLAAKMRESAKVQGRRKV